MFKYILFIILSLNAFSIEYNEKDVLNQILRNKKDIDLHFAKQLSKSIIKVSKKNGINPKVYTAILMQESKYKVDAKRCRNNKCTDFGISQIHYKTASLWGFSTEKLTNDLDYSLDSGARILSYFRNRYRKHELEDYWTRYNCGTRKNVKNQICQDYKKLVARYM